MTKNQKKSDGKDPYFISEITKPTPEVFFKTETDKQFNQFPINKGNFIPTGSGSGFCDFG